MRHFEMELASVRDGILAMGAQVERSLSYTLEGLRERSTRHFELVFGFEKRINQLHIALDEQCLKLLALQSPLASDLRLVLGIIKLNNDLERVGDQAVNIAHNGFHFLMEPPCRLPVDLVSMGDGVHAMVHDALVSFVKGDVGLARYVLERDYAVDNWKNQIFEDQIEAIKANPERTKRSLQLILIARNLERIGDHATNIAEASIFVVSGTDVRHGARVSSEAASDEAARPL